MHAAPIWLQAKTRRPPALVGGAPAGPEGSSTSGTMTIHPDLIDDRGSPTRTIVSGGVSYGTGNAASYLRRFRRDGCR